MIRIILMVAAAGSVLASARGAYGADESSDSPPIQQSPGSAVPAPPVEGSALRQTFRHEAMATVFEFTLYARPDDTSTNEIARIAAEAFAAVDDLERRVSNWIPDSQMSYVNNRAAEGPVRIAPDLFGLLDYARRVYDESGGAFDITVGPLIELWGFYRGQGNLPTDAALQEALEKVGMDKVRLDPTASTVYFEREGIRLDFGGIAKGLAIDQAVAVLRRNGVTAALLHGGTSTVYALGAPPGAPGWKVRVRSPYNSKEWVDEVVLRDCALSTSGSYEKFFELQGRKYCHIFDPLTGRPVEGMLSASALAPSGMQSDALSTAFFVMGLERTEAFCREHPEIRAILVPDPDGGDLKAVRVSFPAEKE